MRFEHHRSVVQNQLKGPDVSHKCLSKNSSVVKDENDSRTSPGMVAVLEL